MADSFEISLGSAGTVSVEIKTSRRMQRMTLRVLPDGNPVVIVPEKMRGNVLEKARNFAEENVLWLKRTIAKVERRGPPNTQTLLAYLRENPTFSAYGKSYTVEFGTASIKPFFVFRESSPVAVICLRDETADADLEQILKRIAAEALPPRTEALANRCSVYIKKISVRDQRSRWGSCTSEGSLSLNWRLLLLPPELQDHVILHELAHRIHMDHSGEFWDLLNAWDSRTGTHDKALSKIWGPRIFAIKDEDS